MENNRVGIGRLLNENTKKEMYEVQVGSEMIKDTYTVVVDKVTCEEKWFDYWENEEAINEFWN